MSTAGLHRIRDDDLPRLITHEATTRGPIADGAVTPAIHQALHEKHLLPAIHLVDTGYLWIRIRN